MAKRLADGELSMAPMDGEWRLNDVALTFPGSQP